MVEVDTSEATQARRTTAAVTAIARRWNFVVNIRSYKQRIASLGKAIEGA